MRLHNVLFLAAAFLLCLLSAASPLAQQPSTINAEDEIRRLNAEEVDAFLKRDTRTMARLWSDDEDLRRHGDRRRP